ncbi:MAG: hypothetical protein J6I85_02915 [Clostridia bacterium]|nr:hypothetical protein [Clostridia bacterium]
MIHHELVNDVMDMLLDGDVEDFKKLREQFYKAKKIEENSSVGFYINFEVEDDESYILENKNFQIGDVYGTVNGQFASVGFILFIKNGKLLMLEGYTNGIINEWPDDRKIILTYENQKNKR